MTFVMINGKDGENLEPLPQHFIRDSYGNEDGDTVPRFDKPSIQPMLAGVLISLYPTEERELSTV